MLQELAKAVENFMSNWSQRYAQEIDSDGHDMQGLLSAALGGSKGVLAAAEGLQVEVRKHAQQARPSVVCF